MIADPDSVVFWITAAKLIIGFALLGIVTASLYRFKAFILTTMGILLLSNVAILALVAGILNRGRQ